MVKVARVLAALTLAVGPAAADEQGRRERLLASLRIRPW